MFTSILAALKALPEIIKILNELGRAYQKMDFESDLKEIESAHDQWEKATSLKDRIAAARRIAAISKRL